MNYSSTSLRQLIRGKSTTIVVPMRVRERPEARKPVALLKTTHTTYPDHYLVKVDIFQYQREAIIKECFTVLRQSLSIFP